MALPRQLAAIMFTDIVGYTAMMQENEAKVLSVVKHYNAVLEKLVSLYRGRVLNYYGDGSLCIFSSATDAVNCAIEVQRELQMEPTVPLRIGLHIGEVFFEEDKALGDGVNVASRIQSLGQENTILISGELHDKIKNNPSIKTVSLGQFDFKNVERPLEVFALSNEGLRVPKRNQLEGKLKKKKSTSLKLYGIVSLLLSAGVAIFYFAFYQGRFKGLSKKVSIAIIPFRNETMNQSLDGYCYGMASEIRTQLSLNNQFEFISSDQATTKYKDSKLPPSEMGNELGVDYLLLGSIYQVNNKLKVTVELADGKSSKSIWSLPPYLTTLSSMEDMFNVQSSIAKKVLEKFSLNGNYSPSIPTTNLAAYNYYLKARESQGRRDFRLAEELFEKAILIDSNYLSAYEGLIFIKSFTFWEDGYDTVKREKELRPYIDFIDRKFPDSWETFMIGGYYYYFGLKDYEKGLDFFSKAFSINPNYDYACSGIAAINRRRLNLKESTKYRLLALEIDPGNPFNWHELAATLSDNGDEDESLECEMIAKKLGLNEEFVNSMILDRIKPERAPSEIQIYYRAYYKELVAISKRDWEGLLKIANASDTSKWYTALNIAVDKAYAFHFLGKTDSAKFYSALALKHGYEDNSNYPMEDMVAIMENDDRAIQYYHNVVEKGYTDHDGQDLAAICDKTRGFIRLLAFIGKYKQATDLLNNLNLDYPGYGSYSNFFKDFHFDRVKKEYPAFNDAVKNLKLPPKIDVSGVIKKFQIRY